MDRLGRLILDQSGPYCLESYSADDDGSTIDITVTVSASSADGLAAAIEALAAEARAGTTYSHQEPGTTNSTGLIVTDCLKFALDRSEQGSGWLMCWQRVSITLAVDGPPVGGYQILYNYQSVSAPGSLSLAGIAGTWPMALDVSVLDASGYDMHSVWCALAPRVLTDDQSIDMGRAHWLILAASLSWTAMSSATGANWWGGTARSTTSASWQTARINTAGYPAGKYKLLARVAQSSGTGYVMDSIGRRPARVTQATPHLVEMGDINLPVSQTALGVASNMTVYARSDGSGTLSVGAFVLLPLDLGAFAMHLSAPTADIDRLDVGPSGIFMDNVTNLADMAPCDVLRPEILASHVQTMVSPASPSGSTWPSEWGRTNSSDVVASSGRIEVNTTTGDKWAWFAADLSAPPLVRPGDWYEFTLTRQLVSRSSGSADVYIEWHDIDGANVFRDRLVSVSSVDSNPVNIELYVKAPAHAARARVRFGASSGASLRAYFSNVVLRRCPLQLLVVCESVDGSLVSGAHPVKLLIRGSAAQEVTR